MEDIENQKHLTIEEGSQIELSHKDKIIRHLEKLLLEKDNAVLKHQQEELKLRIALLDSERYKLSDKIVRKNEQIKAEMLKVKAFHNKLEEKYELSAGWGFDPDSLKIIEKED